MSRRSPFTTAGTQTSQRCECSRGRRALSPAAAGAACQAVHPPHPHPLGLLVHVPTCLASQQQVAEVTEDELFRVECVDWTGGQIKDDDCADDIKNVDLSQVHYLSGPIRVKDAAGQPARPGDLLMVELCNLGPLPGDEWGFTGTFDRENGGGFLTGR